MPGGGLACFGQLVQAGVLDGDAGLPGEHRGQTLVVLGEVFPAFLLGEVEVPEDEAAGQDRDTQEGPHRGMVVGETDGAWILRQVVQADRSRMLDESAEEPASDGQFADALALGFGQPVEHEVGQTGAGLVDHTEGSVPATDHATRRLDDPMENGVQIELSGQEDAGVDECPQAPCVHIRTHGALV